MRVLLFALLVSTAFSLSLKDGLVNFADFKITYNRKYASPAEEAHRFNCFMETMNKAEELNKRDQSARYGVNKFADLCASEFKAMYHNLKITKSNDTYVSPVPKVAPLDSFDWRDHGAVNAIKDQAQCGSCWAFSAVAAMEGAWVVSGKHPLASLSEEELVQCASSAGQGCQGGWMDKAIQWVINNGGITTEADYPYTSGTGITGNCNTAKLSNKIGKFSTLLRAGSVESTYTSYLQAHGPLSIGVDAMDGWQTYQGGVKTACQGSQVDHGVAIVGFGVQGSTPYWIIRNSWGVGWGENGYIRVQRGVNCDLLTYLVTSAVSL
eukprot:NODE_4606_length_1142_cov_588.501472_g4086_i0.p1 GENE.NODE_4606_length_1142_cov_588.501472_g4086_i0~~NODE_4606_length_1142_cov_588.501472_g4086_i0.p1  ORF type:complete len:323 (-),score=71.14 NODE_4606_length_1142_cov_588.501472_g4086_i0:114-1082(-)